jgi:hypothetical protein
LGRRPSQLLHRENSIFRKGMSAKQPARDSPAPANVAGERRRIAAIENGSALNLVRPPAASSGQAHDDRHRSRRQNDRPHCHFVRFGFGPTENREGREGQKRRHAEFHRKSGLELNAVLAESVAAIGSGEFGWSSLTSTLATPSAVENGVLCYSCFAKNFCPGPTEVSLPSELPSPLGPSDWLTPGLR